MLDEPVGDCGQVNIFHRVPLSKMVDFREWIDMWPQCDDYYETSGGTRLEIVLSSIFI